MGQINIGKLNLPYRVDRSKKRKTIGIAVSPQLEIVVKAPEATNLEKIEESLNKKKAWILEKINDFSSQEIPPLDKEFMSGEKLLYKGRRYRLKVKEGKEIYKGHFKYNKGKFLLELPKYEDDKKRKAEAIKVIKEWYVEMAKDQLIGRTKKWAKSMGYDLKKVDVKSYKKSWGITKGSTINYNWRVVLLPVAVQNYIIAHEVAHLEVSKHNGEFWSMVGAIVPDYAEKKKYLRQKGSLFDI